MQFFFPNSWTSYTGKKQEASTQITTSQHSYCRSLVNIGGPICLRQCGTGIVAHLTLGNLLYLCVTLILH